MASKKEMTWNKFRSLHKGVSTNKLSQMWTDYKAGAYKIPDENKSVEEEVVEEKAAKMEVSWLLPLKKHRQHHKILMS